jgi:hypothetical protein
MSRQTQGSRDGFQQRWVRLAVVVPRLVDDPNESGRESVVRGLSGGEVVVLPDFER